MSFDTRKIGLHGNNKMKYIPIKVSIMKQSKVTVNGYRSHSVGSYRFGGFIVLFGLVLTSGDAGANDFFSVSCTFILSTGTAGVEGVENTVSVSC